MQIEWLRQALLDLDEIGEFIAQDNPAAARQTVTLIVEQVVLLREQPALGRAGRVSGTRELVIPALPFIVPYRVRGRIIEVLRVMHASRQWPRRFAAKEPDRPYSGTAPLANLAKSSRGRSVGKFVKPTLLVRGDTCRSEGKPKQQRRKTRTAQEVDQAIAKSEIRGRRG
jgi:addiction module RelE/StbE family toxin